MIKALVLASSIVLVGLSTVASAAEGNWFVRGEAGRSDNSINSGPIDFSDDDNAWSLRGGYWLNRNFAIEAFYSNVYNQEFTGQFNSGGLSGTFQTDVKFRAIGLGVVGKKNFGADGIGFFIDGRAGISRGKVEAALGSYTDHRSSTKPYFGAGLGYDFTQNLGVSLNYDRLKGSSYNFDVTAKTLTLGVEYRF